MSDTFTIRRAAANDLSGILSIIETAVRNTADSDWFVPDGGAFLARHLEERGFILVADSAGAEIAAYLVVRFPGMDEDNLGRELRLPPDELLRVAHIESTAVLPAFYGNRLQSRLAGEAEACLSPGECRHLMATVHPNNHFSLNSMLRQGYRIVATVQKYGGLRRHILYKKLESNPAEFPSAESENKSVSP